MKGEASPFGLGKVGANPVRLIRLKLQQKVISLGLHCHWI